MPIEVDRTCHVRALLCVLLLFFMKTYNRCLVSSQIVIFLLIGNSCLICSSRVLLQTELDIRRSCEQTWQNHEWPWSIHGLGIGVVRDCSMRFSMISNMFVKRHSAILSFPLSLQKFENSTCIIRPWKLGRHWSWEDKCSISFRYCILSCQLHTLLHIDWMFLTNQLFYSKSYV